MNLGHGDLPGFDGPGAAPKPAPPKMVCTDGDGRCAACALHQQHSITACVANVTFGCGATPHAAGADGAARSRDVWVSGGCRGTFYCEGRKVSCGVGGAPPNTYRCPC